MYSDFQFKVTSENGKFSYTILPIDRQNDALNVLTRAFYPYENVCFGTKLAQNAKAVDELNELAKKEIKDGVSIVAVDNTTSDIVGVSINTIEIDSTVDLFQHFDTEKLMEISFVAILPEYGQQGIGYELVKADLQLLAELHEKFEGPNVATAVWTSNLSAKIGERHGFQVLSECSYDQIEYDGVKMSDLVDRQSKCIQVVGKKLKSKKNSSLE